MNWRRVISTLFLCMAVALHVAPFGTAFAMGRDCDHAATGPQHHAVSMTTGAHGHGSIQHSGHGMMMADSPAPMAHTAAVPEDGQADDGCCVDTCLCAYACATSTAMPGIEVHMAALPRATVEYGVLTRQATLSQLAHDPPPPRLLS